MWWASACRTHIITIQSKMYEATSRLDGTIVFSGFMLAVYRKGRFQLPITKLNQQTASKEKGKKRKGKEIGAYGFDGRIKYKNHKTRPKKLGAAQ